MWRIEHDPVEHLLTLQLKEHVGIIEMRGLARALTRALEATGGDHFHVLLDLRGLYPLDVDAAELLSDMKRVAASLPGYQSRAVLVDSPTVAMQQRNTTLEDGGDDSELITLDATAAKRFIDHG
jgi:hypothetical protein